MPIYVCECRSCQHTQDYYSTIAQRNKTPKCEKCGGKTKIIISGAFVNGDLPGYLSHTGRWVEGKKARRDDLKRAGCRPWEGMEAEQKESARQRAYEEARADKKLEAEIRTVYHQLPPEKRRALERS